MNKSTIHIPFNTVTEQQLGNIFRQAGTPMVEVLVLDEEYEDVYTIRMQKTNLGIGGLCFLNGTPSYQADFQSNPGKLKDCVNLISGGVVLA